MSDDINKSEEANSGPFLSAGSVSIGGKSHGYKAKAGWLTLYEKDKEQAQIFNTYYQTTSRSKKPRPLTFVFNGGPGAASAYLHVGAVGPMRVATNTDGSLPPSPAKLVNNSESWLAFTDLVFIDPVGTGLSHARPSQEGAVKKNLEARETEAKNADPEKVYWDVTKDLESLCDFIDAFLSRENRWGSEIYLAGESYGGYRAGRMARMLQEKAGVGLSGVFLISPALEWDHLFAGDYNVLAPTLSLPSFALSAHFHDKAGEGANFNTFRKVAEDFAITEYLSALTAGDARKIAKQTSEMIGLNAKLIESHGGVVEMNMFIRGLKKKEGEVLGRYDAAMTTTDPFPSSPSFEGIDPTLDGMNRIFTTGANLHIRENLGVKSNNKYELLSYKVNGAWQWGDQASGEPVPKGAMGDVAVAMTMNPDMKVIISHGYFDLITPYYVSEYLANQIRQKGSGTESLTLKHYVGGHMFYTWEKSRKAFFKDVAKVFAR
jgi:carboxypeptidase C (cathepsin A)